MNIMIVTDAWEPQVNGVVRASGFHLALRGVVLDALHCNGVDHAVTSLARIF